MIEDMDRLDPAHLFRIMNVFSAHMDYGYRSMQPIDSSLVGNKFGVSNVVFVMHEKILRHYFIIFMENVLIMMVICPNSITRTFFVSL